MIPRDDIKESILSAISSVIVMTVVIGLILSLGGCSGAPYADFKEVPKGKYVIMLEVKDETSYGNNYDGAADNINGIWALQAKPDFCLVVHEIAHVLYKDYHGRYYNECKKQAAN